MRSLADYLESHGIRLREEQFLSVVRDCLERVFRDVETADSPLDLPPGERKRLAEGGFSFEPRDWGLDHPAVRSAALFAALLGSALSVNEVAELLGVNPTRVRQRLSGRKRTLYGIKRDGEWWLPRFQFRKGRTVAGIGEVIASLDPELHPVAVWLWFSTPSPDLLAEDEETRLSPLDWLKAGYEPARVVELAENL